MAKRDMTAPDTADPFTGFGPKALDFFRALAFHQDKVWFEDNRSLYESDVRQPFVALIGSLTARFAAEGLPLRGDARSLFRLHRDTRFAKDKRPYKTNAGAVLTRDGTKRSQGLFYVHVDPEGCFVAAGFYHAEPDQLAALRRRIVDKPDTYRRVVSDLKTAGLALGEGEALSRLPRGFEGVDDPELVRVVKMRSLVTRRPLEADALRRPDLVARLVAFGQEAEPLLRFGWSAIDALPPS